jgi:nicotinamide mononucleotide (NMN) deamidase PncC
MINAVPTASAIFGTGLVYRQHESLQDLISDNGKLTREKASTPPKTIEELANRFRDKTSADYVLATSPSEIVSAKEPNRPVQKLVICCGDKRSLIKREFVIAREQDDFLTFVSIVALDMLRRFLNNLPFDNPYYFDELTRSQLK